MWSDGSFFSPRNKRSVNDRPSPNLSRILVSGLLLGFLVGLILFGWKLSNYPVGRRMVFFPLLAKSVNQAVPVTLALLVLWVVAYRVFGRAFSGERLRALLATALPVLPALAWYGYRLNKEELPGFFEAKSITTNLALVAGAGALTYVISHMLHRWYTKRGSAAPGKAAVAAALLLPVAANAIGVVDRERFQGPKVIVLLIDVLRADHLSCYGYERETSPNIDRFAEEATLFTSAVAQSSFTKTSVASLFSGLYAFRHQVYSGGEQHDLFSNSIDTLAETLTHQGLLSVAWVENPQLRAYLGFEQGFAEYHDQPGHADVIVDEFLDWVDVYGAHNGFFAYLHVLDLHGPYTVPEPFDTRFGRHADTFDGMTWQSWRGYKGRVTDGKLVPPEDDLKQLRALYDGAIAFVDDQVGRLFEGLRDAGIYDETMIVITADHGEGFMEHGFLAHTNTPYQELIHIPMLVKLPGGEGAGQRRDENVALVDLAPTIEDFVGVDLELERDGKSLLPVLRNEGPLERDYIYSELSNRMAVRKGKWKLFYLEPKRRNWLYDLSQDPGEQTNVRELHPDIAADLGAAAAAAAAIRESADAEQTTVDPATVERLRALGYL